MFNDNLLALRLDASPGTVAALDRLHELEPDFVSELKQAFESAKQRVSLRFRQATSYLLDFPWNLCKILSYFCKPISQPVDDQRFVKSKLWAKKLVEEYDTGLLRGAAEFARFLDTSEPLGISMRYWAMSDDLEMNSELLCELLAYGSSLTSMQRLESKHHLVSQRMSIARNSTPSTLSANLRRTLNGDVNSDDFKKQFWTVPDGICEACGNPLALPHRASPSHFWLPFGRYVCRFINESTAHFVAVCAKTHEQTHIGSYQPS